MSSPPGSQQAGGAERMQSKSWCEELLEARESRNRALRQLAGTRATNRRLKELLLAAKTEIALLKGKPPPPRQQPD